MLQTIRDIPPWDTRLGQIIIPPPGITPHRRHGDITPYEFVPSDAAERAPSGAHDSGKTVLSHQKPEKMYHTLGLVIFD